MKLFCFSLSVLLWHSDVNKYPHEGADYN